MKASCMSYDPVAKQFILLEHQGGPVDLIGVKNELLDRLLHSRNCRMANRVTSGYVEEKNLVQLIFYMLLEN